MNHPFPKSQHSLALYAGNTSAPTILPQSGRLPHSRSEGNFRTGSVAAFFQPGNASLLQESQPYFLRHSVLHSIIHSFQKKSSLFLKFYNLYDRINLQLADKRRILQKRGRLFHGSFCRVFGTKAAEDRLKQGLIVAAAVVLSVLIGAISILTGWLFLLVLVIGAIYGAYYLLTGCYTEYEYTVTNGELDVDKIAGRRKRSHLLTVPVSKFTGFGVYTDQTDDPSDATLFLCSDNTGENAYYADFTTEEYGTARLIFTPNEEMVQTIVLFLPAALKRQFRHG